MLAERFPTQTTSRSAGVVADRSFTKSRSVVALAAGETTGTEEKDARVDGSSQKEQMALHRKCLGEGECAAEAGESRGE